MVEEIRKEVQIPLVFMTYANVVYSYGTDRFLQRAKDVGMDGLILPDVPFEEKEDFAPAIVKIIEKYGQDAVPYVEQFVRDMKEAVLKN